MEPSKMIVLSHTCLVLTCFIWGIAIPTVQGCDEIVFLDPPFTEGVVLNLNVTENTPATSEIQTFTTECRKDNKSSETDYHIEGTDKDSFYFDGEILRTSGRISAPIGTQFSIIVVAVEVLFQTSPSYKRRDVSIHVVEAQILDLHLPLDSLIKEIYRGVMPGTKVWTVGIANIMVKIPTGAYSDNFEGTEDLQSVKTQGTLSELPAAIKLPISLISTDPKYAPLFIELNIQLQAIAEPEVLYVKAVSTSEADVCWRLTVSGKVEYYRMSVSSPDKDMVKMVFPSKQNTLDLCAIVNDLLVKQVYEIQIRAVYEDVQSPPSEIYHYTHLFTDPCSPNPCGNGGICIQNAINIESHHCACAPGYTGSSCTQLLDESCENPVCMRNNSDRCKKISDAEVVCACPDDTCSRNGGCLYTPCFYDRWCGERSVVCCDCYQRRQRVLPCTDEGCEDKDSCSNSTIIDTRGIFRWPKTVAERWVYMACPLDLGDQEAPDNAEPIPFAKRFCDRGKDGRAAWLPQDISACPKKPLTESRVSEIIEAIQGTDTTRAASEGLTKITEVLAETATIAARDKQLTKQYLEAIDNVLEAEPNTLQEEDVNTKFVETFENFLDMIDLDVDLRLDLENIKVDVRNVSQSRTKDGVKFTPEISDKDAKAKDSTTIKLPVEVFDKMEASSHRVKFVLYTDSKLFPVDKDSNKTVERVLLAGVNNRTVSGLKSCVEYTMPKAPQVQSEVSYQCVFWDAAKKHWSDKGVHKVAEDGQTVHCCSHHLTNFALLLDVDPDVVIPEIHNQILSIVSYVGSGLSVAGLTLTLVTYALFPCLHRSKSGQILLHLATSMIVMHVLFVVGGDRTVVGVTPGCTALGVLLHFTVVSTLVWMGIEAFNLYRLLVRVFAMYEKHFLLKRVLIGWGVPLAVVTIALAVDLDNYRDPEMTSCRLSSSNRGIYYGTYIAPICVVLLCNLVVFCMLIRVLLKPKFDNSLGKRTVTGAQVRGVLSVLVLLGISWIFGTVAIGDAKLPFQYLFVITTSLQGFCIFIFRCLRNSEAQAAWRQLVHEGTVKTRRGAIIKSSGQTHTSSTVTTVENEKSRGNNSEKVIAPPDDGQLTDKGDKYHVDPGKLKHVGAEKGTFWLNKYRLIMGLEKCPPADNKNVYNNI